MAEADVAEVFPELADAVKSRGVLPGSENAREPCLKSSGSDFETCTGPLKLAAELGCRDCVAESWGGECCPLNSEASIALETEA
jgi:hypothetical protein